MICSDSIRKNSIAKGNLNSTILWDATNGRRVKLRKGSSVVTSRCKSFRSILLPYCDFNVRTVAKNSCHGMLNFSSETVKERWNSLSSNATTELIQSMKKSCQIDGAISFSRSMQLTLDNYSQHSKTICSMIWSKYVLLIVFV